MDCTEKTISSEPKFSGRVFSVRVDKVALPNGHTSFREVVDHNGGVAVVPVDNDGCVIAVRQFRYPFMKELLEIPAGKLEKGEDPLECAVRELSEETGFSAAEMIPLGAMYPSPGFCRETLYIYLALGLTPGEAHLDEDEFLNVERVPLDKLVSQIMSCEVCDGKTVAGVLKAQKYLESRG